jgi:hypothetical protein
MLVEFSRNVLPVLEGVFTVTWKVSPVEGMSDGATTSVLVA